MIFDIVDIKCLEDYVKVNNTEVIISDIFDTILCRKVHPEYVKKLVSARLSSLFLGISELEFYQIRQHAELYCYENSKTTYGEQEISYPYLISNIYDLLKEAYGDVIYLSKDAFFQVYQLIELAVECQNQIPDQNIVNFLRNQKVSGKKVILLSDFYMGSDLIELMLKYHDINDLYIHLIVSSDFMKTKRSGSLYELIIKNGIVINPEKALMVGDNYYSDIISAQQCGFKTYQIQRELQRKFYDQQQKKAFLKKELISDINILMKKQEDIIFEHISLVLMNTVTKLYQKCIEGNIKKIYFLSREGKIVKDLFDKYQTHIVGKTLGCHNISTYYLFASRRSTAVASLSSLKDEKFETLFRQYVNISIKQFSLSYDFDIEKVTDICSSLNIDIDLIHLHLPSSNDFNRLIQNSDFISYYDDFRLMQRKNFLDYLSSLNFSLEDEELVLFDLGWKGTIQDNIYNILKKEGKSVKGFYMGLVASGNLTEKNYKEGLLFDFRYRDWKYWVYRENLSLFEIILNADHGSVKRYNRDESGKVIAELEDNLREREIFHSKIYSIHKNIYDFYEKLLLLFDKYAVSMKVTENYIACLHKAKLFSPNKKEREWFEDIQHFENFGLFTYSEFHIDKKFSLRERIKQFIVFVKNPRKYIYQSFWPSLRFIKEGIGFMIPIYKFYLFYIKRLKI